jgi:hypothetical protein
MFEQVCLARGQDTYLHEVNKISGKKSGTIGRRITRYKCTFRASTPTHRE